MSGIGGPGDLAAPQETHGRGRLHCLQEPAEGSAPARSLGRTRGSPAKALLPHHATPGSGGSPETDGAHPDRRSLTQTSLQPSPPPPALTSPSAFLRPSSAPGEPHPPRRAARFPLRATRFRSHTGLFPLAGPCEGTPTAPEVPPPSSADSPFRGLSPQSVASRREGLGCFCW